MKRSLALSFAALIVLAGLAGCSSKSSIESTPQAMPAPMAPAERSMQRQEAAYDAAYDMAGEPGGESGVDVTALTAESRKMVVTVDLALETMEFDAGLGEITALTDSMGGFVQDSYVQGINMNSRDQYRYASYTIRVPADKLRSFLDGLGSRFNVLHEQQSSSDISASYFDSTARLSSLRVQEERLIAILETATELKYILEIERELANVLYQIETITSAINRMDNSVSLATVTLSLQEVGVYVESLPTPVTFGQRMRYALTSSWETVKSIGEGFVLFLVVLIPYLPLLAIIALIVVLVVRRQRKRALDNPPIKPAYPPVYTIPNPPPPPVNPHDPRGPSQK